MMSPTFMAHTMYAFLLINLMNFSKHHKQHLHIQRRHLKLLGL